jgi:hypothetical protein
LGSRKREVVDLSVIDPAPSAIRSVALYEVVLTSGKMRKNIMQLATLDALQLIALRPGIQASEMARDVMRLAIQEFVALRMCNGWRMLCRDLHAQDADFLLEYSDGLKGCSGQV